MLSGSISRLFTDAVSPAEFMQKQIRRMTHEKMEGTGKDAVKELSHGINLEEMKQKPIRIDGFPASILTGYLQTHVRYEIGSLYHETC
jgi:hypothetical protein